MFVHSCTIINAATDHSKKAPVYRATHLQGVLWDETSGAKVGDKGMASSNTVTVHIPFKVKASKTYVPPLEYQNNSENTWTLKASDILIKGLEVVPSSEAFFSLAELQAKFELFKIETINTIDYGPLNMQHWEVNGG